MAAEAFGRDLHGFRRQAAGDLPVGMVFGDELAVAALQFSVAHGPVCGEDEIGIVGAEHVPRRDALEIRVDEREDRRHIPQIGILGLVNGLVRLGDVEQAVEHVFEQRRLVRESFADLAGVGLEAVGGLHREFEQAVAPVVLFSRHVDDLLEGARPPCRRRRRRPSPSWRRARRDPW